MCITVIERNDSIRVNCYSITFSVFIYIIHVIELGNIQITQE